MMGVFYIYAVQYGSYRPHVATEHLKCDNGGTEFLTLKPNPCVFKAVVYIKGWI